MSTDSPQSIRRRCTITVNDLNCSAACMQRHIYWLVCHWGTDRHCYCEFLNKVADNQNSLAGGTVEGSLQPVHTNCPCDSILIHLNPHRTLHFNIILPIWPTFTSSTWSRPFRFCDQNFASVLTSPCGLNVISKSSYWIWLPQQMYKSAHEAEPVSPVNTHILHYKDQADDTV